jgi:hypothetical protein
VKVADEELELWKEAAWLERLTLSAWVRAQTNQAAKRRVRKGLENVDAEQKDQPGGDSDRQ